MKSTAWTWGWRFGATTYVGQFNVRADSGITTLEDVKGKVMCWVDPNSTSGYIIPRIMLAANGIDPDNDFSKTIETGSHNNSVQAVYEGECDVGVSYADARSSIEETHPDVKDVVAVLATTTEIPNDSVSFAKDLDPEVRTQIVNALLEISATEEGVEALNNLYSIDALVAAEDSFYDGFRADLSKAGMDVESLVE
jgi:phosphonate transport system substrate-binding protein